MLKPRTATSTATIQEELTVSRFSNEVEVIPQATYALSENKRWYSCDISGIGFEAPESFLEEILSGRFSDEGPRTLKLYFGGQKTTTISIKVHQPIMREVYRKLSEATDTVAVLDILSSLMTENIKSMVAYFAADSI